MATLKYSRQRESIQNYLSSTREHPTADMVYMHVKSEYPKVSLGTVYRNLGLLTDMGEILKINTPNGGHRFDGFTTPHDHFICNKCNKVVDIKRNELHPLQTLDEKSFSGNIDCHFTTFYGICEECKQEERLS